MDLMAYTFEQWITLFTKFNGAPGGNIVISDGLLAQISDETNPDSYRWALITQGWMRIQSVV